MRPKFYFLCILPFNQELSEVPTEQPPCEAKEGREVQSHTVGNCVDRIQHNTSNQLSHKVQSLWNETGQVGMSEWKPQTFHQDGGCNGAIEAPSFLFLQCFLNQYFSTWLGNYGIQSPCNLKRPKLRNTGLPE